MVVVMHMIKIDRRADSRGQIEFRLQTGAKRGPALRTGYLGFFKSVVSVPGDGSSFSESVRY